MNMTERSLDRKKENGKSPDRSGKVEIREERGNIVFEIKSRNRDENVAIANVTVIGQRSDDKKIYKLKNINSFRRGAGSRLLREINDFVEKNNGAIVASVRTENEARFQKLGWKVFGSNKEGARSITMVYNMDDAEE